MSGFTSPDFLTSEQTNHNDTQQDSAVVDISGTDRTIIIWSLMNEGIQRSLFNLIMEYAAKNSVLEAAALPVPSTPGWHRVNFEGSVVAGNPTGFYDTVRTYTTEVVVDGTPIFVEVPGSTATFAALIVAINADLGAAATAAIINGNIEITSSTSGIGSSVVINELDLFKRLNGWVNMGAFFHGVDNVEGVITLNFINGERYKLLLDGAYVIFGAKPSVIPFGPFSKDLVYFDHATTTWKHFYDDSPA